MRPDYFEAYHNLGQALESSGHLSEAIDQYNIEARLRPELAAPLLAAGTVCILLCVYYRR